MHDERRALRVYPGVDLADVQLGLGRELDLHPRARRRAKPVREERTTFAVLAADESDAIELGTARFREDALQSNVGWVRIITRCEAHPVELMGE
jgi:hypothetical protein